MPRSGHDHTHGHSAASRHEAGWPRRSSCSPRSWSSRSSARSSPARSPCCPTPGTCSPTSSASAWRWPPSTSPARGSAPLAPHVRPVPPGDPRRPGQRRAAARRRRVRADRGDPPLRRPGRRARRADARRRRRRPRRQPRRLRPAARGRDGVAERRGRLPRGARRHRRLGRRHRRRRRASQATGWTWVDPVVGIAIGLWIVPRTLRLAGQALRILVQAAPPGTDIDALRADLAAVDGVVDVHDLHVWTLTSDMDVASAHLMVATTHRPPPRARLGARRAARPLRHRPRHVASRTGGPPRLRRGGLVSASSRVGSRRP